MEKTFSELWDTEVRPLAEACVDREIVELLCKENRTEQEKKDLEEKCKNYKDVTGMYYISELIWHIEHALADNRPVLAGIQIVNVYGVLNDPTYFSNVYKGDANDEEWQKRAALRDGLKKLMNAKKE